MTIREHFKANGEHVIANFRDDLFNTADLYAEFQHEKKSMLENNIVSYTILSTTKMLEHLVSHKIKTEAEWYAEYVEMDRELWGSEYFEDILIKAKCRDLDKECVYIPVSVENAYEKLMCKNCGTIMEKIMEIYRHNEDLKTLKDQLGLTRQELADLMMINRRRVSEYLSNQKPIPLGVWELLKYKLKDRNEEA